MIIYHKELKNPQAYTPINLRKLFEEFDFRKYMHTHQSNKINDVSFISDLIASFAEVLHENEKLEDKLILKALQSCRDIMQHNGYHELNIQRFREKIDKNKESVIAVYGCQTRGILHNRVRAAVNLWKIIPTKIHIIFSGRSPLQDGGDTIENEAIDMENRFYEFAEIYQDFNQIEQIDRITTRHIIIESESTKTTENIQKLMETSTIRNAESLNLFLVSSNFHLMKLSKEFEDYIQKNNITKITEVYAIGSESINTLDHVSRKKQYIKALFYHLYNFILTNSQ
jgi:hypothetical protein